MRRSTTSTETPDASSSSAAVNAIGTMRMVATTVTSVPSRAIAAFPSGVVWYPSGTSPRARYSALCSRNRTGSSDSIDASSRPLASAGFDGATITMPGTLRNHPSTLWE